jgi:hypothetical protein
VTTRNLEDAGITPLDAGTDDESPDAESDALVTGSPARELPTIASAPDRVPAELFRELQWKHEQLLVQYGMMRAGGLRAVELREQLTERDREIERQRQELGALRRRQAEEIGRLERELRQARFDLEGRNLEVAALEQKVRGLELLTRNRVTSESIDEQYDRLVQQAHRIGRRVIDRRSDGHSSRERRRAWIVRDVPVRDDH